MFVTSFSHSPLRHQCFVFVSFILRRKVYSWLVMTQQHNQNKHLRWTKINHQTCQLKKANRKKKSRIERNVCINWSIKILRSPKNCCCCFCFANIRRNASKHTEFRHFHHLPRVHSAMYIHIFIQTDLLIENLSHENGIDFKIPTNKTMKWKQNLSDSRFVWMYIVCIYIYCAVCETRSNVYLMWLYITWVELRVKRWIK